MSHTAGLVALIDATDCPVCGQPGTIVAAGEVGTCLDGHGDDCPDRLCVDCGVALLVDPLIPDVAADREAAGWQHRRRGA